MSAIQFPVRPPKAAEGVLQFPKLERRRVIDDIRRRAKSDPSDPEPERFYIQGKRARRTEWMVWKALLKLGFDSRDIQFQVGFAGGRNFKNGFIVDFIVNTRPLPTPVWVHGEYWHDGEQSTKDWVDQQRLNQLHPGTFARAIVFWGTDLMTEESAFFNAIDKLGRP